MLIAAADTSGGRPAPSRSAARPVRPAAGDLAGDAFQRLDGGAAPPAYVADRGGIGERHSASRSCSATPGHRHHRGDPETGIDDILPSPCAASRSRSAAGESSSASDRAAPELTAHRQAPHASAADPPPARLVRPLHRPRRPRTSPAAVALASSLGWPAVPAQPRPRSPSASRWWCPPATSVQVRGTPGIVDDPHVVRRAHHRGGPARGLPPLPPSTGGRQPEPSDHRLPRGARGRPGRIEPARRGYTGVQIRRLGARLYLEGRRGVGKAQQRRVVRRSRRSTRARWSRWCRSIRRSSSERINVRSTCTSWSSAPARSRQVRGSRVAGMYIGGSTLALRHDLQHHRAPRRPSRCRRDPVRPRTLTNQPLRASTSRRTAASPGCSVRRRSSRPTAAPRARYRNGGEFNVIIRGSSRAAWRHAGGISTAPPSR